MTHRVLKQTLGVLQVPAMLVAIADSDTILAVNPRAREEVSYNLLEGSNYVKVINELKVYGDVLQDSAYIAVRDGGQEMASRLVHVDGRIDRPTWFVASKIPDVHGYPPSALLTVHAEPYVEGRAREYHVRDRMAVETAIVMDEMRFQSRQMLNMAMANMDSLDHATKVWLDRVSTIEPVLPQT